MSLSAESKKVKKLNGMIIYHDHRDKLCKRCLKMEEKVRSTGCEQLRSGAQKKRHSKQILRKQSSFEGGVRSCSEVNSDPEVQLGRHAAKTGRTLRTSWPSLGLG